MIKPCPFCGGEASLDWKKFENTGQTIVWITCEECGARTKGIRVWERKIDDAVKKAAELWERRTNE